MKKKPCIVLGVAGSIAAYKAVDLVRSFTAEDWNVRVIMTAAAMNFVGELTFRSLSRNPVGTDMFPDGNSEWKSEHISFAESADVLVIAPCTAATIARLAHGFADDLLGCTVLACEAPVILAPAMNEKMWNNPATRANVKTLRSRGIRIIEVEEGDLACGVKGRGRLAAPDRIVAAVRDCLATG